MNKAILQVSTHGNDYIGRLLYDGNLIIETAPSVINLENKMKSLVNKFNGVSDIFFTIKYDIPALFKEFSFIKISSVAPIAGINSSLLRQYASHKKLPSDDQVKKVEWAIRRIGESLSKIDLYSDLPS